jgi:hypothetical protein
MTLKNMHYGNTSNSSNSIPKGSLWAMKLLSTKPDIDLTYYGFQNFQKRIQYMRKSKGITKCTNIWCFFANEKKSNLDSV